MGEKPGETEVVSVLLSLGSTCIFNNLDDNDVYALKSQSKLGSLCVYYCIRCFSDHILCTPTVCSWFAVNKLGCVKQWFLFTFFQLIDLLMHLNFVD